MSLLEIPFLEREGYMDNIDIDYNITYSYEVLCEDCSIGISYEDIFVCSECGRNLCFDCYCENNHKCKNCR